MKCEWRLLRKGETDHELLWLLVGSVSLVGAWFWLKLEMPWPSCGFLRVTGFPCLTCGATRCFLLLTHGKIGAAFLMNPLAFFALTSAIIFAAYASIVLLFRLPRLRLHFPPHAARVARFAFVVLLFMNWGYLIASGRTETTEMIGMRVPGTQVQSLILTRFGTDLNSEK